MGDTTKAQFVFCLQTLFKVYCCSEFGATKWFGILECRRGAGIMMKISCLTCWPSLCFEDSATFKATRTLHFIRGVIAVAMFGSGSCHGWCLLLR